MFRILLHTTPPTKDSTCLVPLSRCPSVGVSPLVWLKGRQLSMDLLSFSRLLSVPEMLVMPHPATGEGEDVGEKCVRIPHTPAEGLTSIMQIMFLRQKKHPNKSCPLFQGCGCVPQDIIFFFSQLAVLSHTKQPIEKGDPLYLPKSLSL